MPDNKIAHYGEVKDPPEQRLWRAVIANTVEEWVNGPLRQKREAEQFLFHDESDYRTVCFQPASILRIYALACKKSGRDSKRKRRDAPIGIDNCFRGEDRADDDTVRDSVTRISNGAEKLR